MRVTQAEISIPTSDKTCIKISRYADYVTIRHDGPDREDRTTASSFAWEDFCKIPAAIDELRRLFGEKTAMDH